MQLFSQRDPAWANHPLGWGPALGTIGEYGCLDTVDAMIATDSGHPFNPADMDDLFTSKGIFVRESTGTFDLLTDDALARAFPADYSVQSFWGFRGDLVAAAVPTPNVYAVAWISTASVPTHFVLFYSADARYIADPWTGRVGTLAGYGGPAAVKKTVLVTRLAPPTPAPPPPPVPLPPEPVPPPAPVPMALYSFVTGDDTHPADQVTTLADAMSLADDWSSSHAAAAIKVLENGAVVYDLPAGVVPKTA